METDQDIGDEAIHIFQEQFQEDNHIQDFGIFNCIPRLLTEEDKDEMERCPEEEETRAAIFGLNKDSASGPDGFAGGFF